MRITSLPPLLGILALAACGTTTTAEPSSTDPMAGHSGASASGPAPSASPVASNQVTISNFAFDPPVIIVSAGTTVTWTNQDQDAHTVSFSGGQGFASPAMQKGDTFTHTFTTPGTFAYVCSIHPMMHGEVIVR